MKSGPSREHEAAWMSERQQLHEALRDVKEQ